MNFNALRIANESVRDAVRVGLGGLALLSAAVGAIDFGANVGNAIANEISANTGVVNVQPFGDMERLRAYQYVYGS